jgi:hypothetical protein
VPERAPLSKESQHIATWLVMKGKRLLSVLFVALVADDVWSVVQLLRKLFAHHNGGAGFWTAFVLVATFQAGLIWLTVRIGKRLRPSLNA